MTEKREPKQNKFYAFKFMILAELFALALLVSGLILRQTLLAGMPQYDSVATIALPMMVLKDHSQIMAQRAHILQYHLPCRHHPWLLQPVQSFQAGYRCRQVQELPCVRAQVQGFLH